MSFTDMIKNSVLEGFSYNDITTTKIAVTLGIAFAIAMYTHLVYKLVTKNAFYNKSYGVSMVIMSIITAGIILAMQSSLVISLGMVGALSIVRFRTAIKDPLDLLFLFWSISTGIICGAGLYELAILTSLAATLGIFIFHFLPVRKSGLLLVINADDKDCFDDIMQVIQSQTASFRIKSKNTTKDGLELILEIKPKSDSAHLTDMLFSLVGVNAVNLLENDIT